jgi:hypothetical protein
VPKTELINQDVLALKENSMMDLTQFVLPVPKDVILVHLVTLVSLVLQEELMLQIVDVLLVLPKHALLLTK